jgi:hypothetical protein
VEEESKLKTTLVLKESGEFEAIGTDPTGVSPKDTRSNSSDKNYKCMRRRQQTRELRIEEDSDLSRSEWHLGGRAQWT